MPVDKQLTVEANNHPQWGIRLGDQITLPRGITGIVQSIAIKSTYTWVTLVGGSQGKFPIGSEVKVTRVVPTEDEELSAKLAKINELVSREWSSSKALMESRVKALNEKFQSGIDKGYIELIDLDIAAAAKQAEMLWVLWETVRAHMVEVLDKPDTHPGGAALRALMRVRVECESYLTKRYQTALSRSTSVIANLEDDMRREAKAEFLSKTDYMGVESLWESVGGVL